MQLWENQLHRSQLPALAYLLGEFYGLWMFMVDKSIKLVHLGYSQQRSLKGTTL
jgi:hypothetical protein